MLSLPAQSKLEIRENPAKWLKWILVFLFILTGIALRYSGLTFRSLDIRDYLLDWYNALAAHGHDAFREPFSNYTPPYIYLLYLMTKTAGIIPKITAIKLIPIGFDFLNAFLVYKILKIRYPQDTTAWIGASAFLLLPTVWMNSAYWGQSDAIYTFFLLGCIFFLIKDQPLVAMISLGLSFSFKAQAAFLGPLILLLMIKKKMPWYYLAIIPLMYVLMILPAAALGRPIMELLTVYAGQADTYQMLSMNAPNLYFLIPNTFYQPGLILGLVVTILVALIWVAIYQDKIKDFTPQTILLYALVAAAFMPFFLPKMHDRYFYLAEVLSFLVAFYFPQGWRLALGYQVISGLTYLVFMRSSLGVTRIQTSSDFNILLTAAIFNTILMGYLFWYQWKWQKAMNGEAK